MEQQFLENLYKGTVNIFLQGFSETEKQELLSSYKQYIIDNYSNLLTLKIRNGKRKLKKKS